MGDATIDPLTATPRELMQAILPAARGNYIKAWELLADADTPRERRQRARARVKLLAEEHTAALDVLRSRDQGWRGEDLRTARHLADELERHVDALGKLATISARGLHESQALRPDALGCGRRFRIPELRADAGSASRDVPNKPAAKQRDPRAQRNTNRPFADRGPKVSRDQLGTGRHESQLGDSLDEETRARLEALRGGQA